MIYKSMLSKVEERRKGWEENTLKTRGSYPKNHNDLGF